MIRWLRDRCPNCELARRGGHLNPLLGRMSRPGAEYAGVSPDGDT